MDIESYKENSNKLIEKNFSALKPLMEYQPIIFCEIFCHINEVCKCLMSESHYGAITLTNYIVEKLLKKALIEDYNELAPIPYPPQKHWEEAHKKYSKLLMHQSIRECYEKGLLTENQRNKLITEIKNQFRNGFSHADLNLIFKEHST